VVARPLGVVVVTASVVLGSVVVAGPVVGTMAGGGGWYWWSSRSRSVSEAIGMCLMQVLHIPAPQRRSG
jgi:hypothetical protein